MRADDGEQLDDLPAPPFTDNLAEPGKHWYYAVFADRGGVFSQLGAVAGPVVPTTDVTNLLARAGDQHVFLEWTLPPGAEEAEVWRVAQTEPRQRGEGQRVACSRSSAHDTRLANNTPYGYRVVAVFAGPDGKPRHAAGVTCLVTPVRPPPPVTDLLVTIQTVFFEATWPSPPLGQVQIFSLPAAPTFAVGELIPLANLPALLKLPVAAFRCFRASDALVRPPGVPAEIHLRAAAV